MDQPLNRVGPGRSGRRYSGASASSRPVVAADLASGVTLPQAGQTCGKFESGSRFGIGRRSRSTSTILRNNVTRPLDGHRVAHPEVLAVADRHAVLAVPPDLVLEYVQRHIGHNHAANRHRGRVCPTGVSAAGAPNLDIDIVRSTVVGALSAGNLCASAQRGEPWTTKSQALDCQSSRSTL